LECPVGKNKEQLVLFENIDLCHTWRLDHSFGKRILVFGLAIGHVDTIVGAA
jgi:hypothetical protein